MRTDNMTLGPGLVRLGDDIDTTLKVNEIISLPEIDDSPAFTFTQKASFEFKGETTFNTSLLEELAGLKSDPQPFYMEYDGYRYEQVRRHKKKRINKKWAKRYGYRAVPCKYRIENCYIQPEPFNDWSIVSDPPKITCSNLYERFGGKR